MLSKLYAIKSRVFIHKTDGKVMNDWIPRQCDSAPSLFSMLSTVKIPILTFLYFKDIHLPKTFSLKLYIFTENR